MAWLEQIPVAGENEEFQEWINTLKKEITNANLQTDEDIESDVVTDSELSEEEVEEQANEDVSNPESKKQIEEVITLWNLYKNWEMKDAQREQYKKYISDTIAYLNETVPTFDQMKELLQRQRDISYYAENREAAEKEANNTIENIGNSRDIEDFMDVASNYQKLPNSMQDKFKAWVNKVYNDLDKDAWSALA